MTCLTNEIIQICNFLFVEISMYNFTFILVCCLTFPFGYGFAGLSAYSLTVDDYQGIFTKILSRFSMFGASHFSMRKNTINELNFLQLCINAFMIWGLGWEFLLHGRGKSPCSPN